MLILNWRMVELRNVKVFPPAEIIDYGDEPLKMGSDGENAGLIGGVTSALEIQRNGEWFPKYMKK